MGELLEEKENELMNVAMQIILHAGDARIKTEEAIEKAKLFDFESAEMTLKEAKECLRLAHIAQTQVIQNETSGKVYESCLLFTHAQDTLMTIMSEEKLATELISMFKILNDKIEQK